MNVNIGIYAYNVSFNCRCWAELQGNSSAEARKKALLKGGKADFKLKPDLTPNDSIPFYRLDLFSEVNEYENIIIEESKRVGIDPDFVKAIIYIETTQGYYDRLLPGFNHSIRPMNIQAEYWQDLGYTREQLENPRLNIRAGCILIKRIKEQMPGASVQEIATIYNDLNAQHINDYGARVARILREKPWIKDKPTQKD